MSSGMSATFHPKRFPHGVSWSPSVIMVTIDKAQISYILAQTMKKQIHTWFLFNTNVSSIEMSYFQWLAAKM